jgi:predicted metal-dependent hydrolase
MDRSRNDIPVRKVEIPFDDTIPRHWFGGNAWQTHFFNGLNLVFPDGERFFIRAVQDRLDRVEDPGLLAQARGFAGQEGRHAHEHERYFEILAHQGYAVERFLGRFKRFVAWTNRFVPAPLRLAMTAGAEHYTATLGHLVLGDSVIDEAHPTMRQLILWHAAEEIEHKAVAFDVLRDTHPSYALRILGFVIATVLLFGWAGAGRRMLLRQDGIDRREATRQLRALRARDGGRFPKALLAGMRAYLRRDFHPADVDDLPLARSRLVEIGLSA